MHELPICPDPLTRAPRAAGGGQESATERLHLPPASLQGVLVALLSRDVRGRLLTPAQGLSHFPASPFVTLSWFQGMEAGLVERGESGAVWRPFGSQVVIAGSQSRPSASWAPIVGRGCIACFTPDVAQALFGLDLASVHDRYLPAEEVLDASWAPLWAALLATTDDAATMAVLEEFLGDRWRRLHGRTSSLPTLRQLGRHWVERLGWQAMQWRRVHSQRHVERRVKSYSGRSLREWQALVRTEGLFFAARERHENGKPVDWAALAQDEGFADQAHMTREAKRVTGFTPGDFARRFIEDESFWMYRLWV